MHKGSSALIVMVGVLAVAVAVGIFYLGGTSSSSSPSPTPVTTPIPTIAPSITLASTPTSNPSSTPNSEHTVTYSEQSKNQTILVIQFKLEPSGPICHNQVFLLYFG